MWSSPILPGATEPAVSRDKITSVITFVVVLTGVSLAIFMHFEIPTVKPFEHGDLRAVYVPDDDNPEGKKTLISVTVFSVNKDNPVKKVELLYKEKKEHEFQQSEFVRLKDTFIYNDFMPGLPKGKRFFYSIRIEDSKGDVLVLPPTAEQKERPVYYYVTYEGHPGRVWLILHIVLAIGAIIYWIHTFYYCICHLQTGQEIFFRKAYNSAFWGNVAFFIFAVPLGCLIAVQTFGKPWTGIPVGWDITDNKSLITLVFYTVALLGARFRIFTARTFAVLGIVGLILTIIVYNIPHSYFIQ